MNQPAAALEPLAQDGGAPLRARPFAPWPVFAEDERKASDAVLASGKVNYWTGGECKAFEAEFAASIGVAHAISLANGTLALELGLRALGVGPGDEVIVPAKTFVATASCAIAVGATPIVCDVDPDTQNLSAATVLPAITPRTRAIIPVHLAGWPCDMTALMALARDREHPGAGGLRAGGGRALGRQAGGQLRRHGGVFLLPGQNHHHRRRGRDAGDQPPRPVGESLGVQGPRQVLGGGEPDRPSAGLQVAA